MNKHLLFLALIVLSLLSCNKKTDPKTITLITTGYPDSTMLFLGSWTQPQEDTGYVINNKLVFTTPLTAEPCGYSLFPVMKTRADMDIREVWKENKALIIHASKGNLKNAIIEGSETQLIADSVKKLHVRTWQIRDSLNLLIYPLDRVKDRTRREALIAESNLDHEVDKAIDSVFIATHPNCFYSVYLLHDRMSEMTTSMVRNLYNGLDSTRQASSYGLKLKRFVRLAQDVKGGDQAIDFSLPNLDGKFISLSSFKGQYLLLEFWGTNCGPCRMETPNLLHNYKKYHKKGFEILGVTLDTKKEDWSNTVKSDSMIWNTVGDLKGFETDIALRYKVEMIPTNYLINPEGIIIAKNLRGNELGFRLDSIFTHLPNSKHHE